MSSIKFVRVLSGNLGDGWNDQLEAASGYAAWLEETEGVETEVVDAQGVSGGYFDANGDEVDGGYLWDRWCASSDAEKYYNA